MNDESPSTNSTTTNQSGRPTLTDFDEYSEDQKHEVFQKYPVSQRYAQLLNQKTNGFDSEIRLQRHRAWLNSVFAEHFSTATTADICEYWSNTADSIIRLAWQQSGLASEPLCLFAIGKLGSSELNLSSDVDLLLVSHSTYSPSTKIQKFQKSLQQASEFGFGFRVDFDLRPGGRLGPLISSKEQFEDYYGTFGATWERLAMIRLRGLAGDEKEIEAVEEIARKFTFRKYIDYTLFEDFKELRPQIHAVDAKVDNQFNLKLHPGGIRDIELYVHAMQVIHGGKIPTLHTRSTTEAINELRAKKLLPGDVADFLRESYWRLRKLENLSQAKGDLQIHTIELDSIDRESFQEMVLQVDRTVSELLGETKSEDNPLPTNFDEHSKWFENLGFNFDSIEEPWTHLFDMKARSRSQQRDEKERHFFLSSFVKETSEVSLDRELAIHHLNDFIGSTRAKASFFTMFNREPRMIRDLAFMMSLSPYLAQILVRRPELLDSFLLQLDEPPPETLEEAMDALTDQRLITELVTAQNFLPQRNIAMLTDALTERADTIATSLLQLVKKDLGCESSDLSILTMGKWAGYEMGFRSDLDFIFVTRSKVEESDHKIARRFLSALSAQTRGGQIYAFDLRLRPSGNSGPLIVSVESLEDFLRNQAEPWERQAYTKSRLLGTYELPVREILAETPLTDEHTTRLREIRRSLKKENLSSNSLDLKYSDGGIVDLEFAVQTFSLLHQTPLSSASTVQGIRDLAAKHENWKTKKDELILNYGLLREYEQLHQLCSNQAGSKISVNSEAFARIARLFQLETAELEERILGLLKDSANCLQGLDPCSATE